MKKFISTILAAVISTAVFAQVSGTVLDSLTREPDAYATVQFLAGEKVVAYTMTDENGVFNHILPNGEYVFYYTNVGRLDKKISFALAGAPVDLGEILVEDDAEVLNSAKVVAQKTLVKMEVDKVSYAVSEDTQAQNSTVLDMLRKVPMVAVDGNDNITVNGSSSFQVYVDGKPNQMISSNPSQVLKTMPASVVKNIEVVTNPGAKYDAEGVGGVLNIITNAAAGSAAVSDGVYGSVGVMASNRGEAANAYISAQKGKFNFGLNAAVFNVSLGGTESTLDRTQYTPSGDINTIAETNINKFGLTGAIAGLNMGYEIDSLNLVSASANVMGMYSRTGFESNNAMSMAGTSIGSYLTTGTQNKNKTSISASIDYQHLWPGCKDRNLIVSYQFSAGPDHGRSNTNFDGTSYGMNLADRYSNTYSNSYNHTLQSDFTTPLGMHSKLNAGVKAILRHNLSDSQTFLSDDSTLSAMKYDFYNEIAAGYAEYEGNFGFFGFKAGTRYEHTFQSVKYGEGMGEDFHLNYGNLVPSASMQFNIGAKQNIGLAYNMRISRPGINYLNPFVDETDPAVRSYGNTDLDAERGHSLSLVYNFMSPKFVTSLTLRENYTGNGISQYSFYDDANILNTTYGNIVQSSVTGINGYFMYMPFLSTRIILNGGIDYSILSSKQLSQSNRGLGYNAMLSLQQTLPWELNLGLTVISSGKKIDLQGYSTGMNMGVISLSKSFFDNKLSVAIQGNGGLAKGLRITSKSYSEGPDFKSLSTSRMPLGQIGISLKYSFGKQFKVKSVGTNKSNDIIDVQDKNEALSKIATMQ